METLSEDSTFGSAAEDEEELPTSRWTQQTSSQMLEALDVDSEQMKFGLRIRNANNPNTPIGKLKKREELREVVPRLFTFDPEVAAQSGPTEFCDLFEKEEIVEDFNEIVDLDHERIEEVVAKDLVGKVTGNVWFRTFIIGATVVNAILIGAQTNQVLSQKYAWMFFLFDHAVLSIFVAELMLKWYQGFSIYWKVGWNIIDFIVIVVLLLGPALTFLGSSTNFRIIRVLRAFRGLRSVRFSTGLTIVLETLLGSIPDITNVAILLTTIMLMFGIVGVFLFGRNFPVHFGNIQSAMYSLFICLTQDGWVVVLEKMRNTNYYVIGAFYFILVITIGVFVFTNLVVAVVISNTDKAIKMVRNEKKMREDILSTKNIERDSEMDFLHIIPVNGVATVLEKADLTLQKPLYFGDFENLTPEKLEHYIILLGALQDNLAEYKTIKTEIAKTCHLVWEMNQFCDEMEQEGESEPVRKSDLEIVATAPLERSALDLTGTNGDVLTRLLNLNKSYLMSTRESNLSKFIKQAARNVPGAGNVPRSLHSSRPGSAGSHRSHGSAKGPGSRPSSGQTNGREIMGTRAHNTSSSAGSLQRHKDEVKPQETKSEDSLEEVISSVASGELPESISFDSTIANTPHLPAENGEQEDEHS